MLLFAPAKQLSSEMPEGAFLYAALLAYLVPVVAMIVSVLLAKGAGLGDGAATALSLAGFIAGYCCARAIVRSPRMKAKLRPVILTGNDKPGG